MSAADSCDLQALLAAQEAILAEVRALRLEVGELRAERARAPALRADDRAVLARVLPVLRETFGAGRFAAWEAIDLAGRPGTVGVNLRMVLGDMGAPALGRLLARGAGADVEGIRLVRDGRDGNGTWWRCGVTGTP